MPKVAVGGGEGRYSYGRLVRLSREDTACSFGARGGGLSWFSSMLSYGGVFVYL